MSGTVVVNQPGVFLVDADGNVITAEDGTAIADHEGLLIAGKDGTTIRFMRVAADGTLRIDPTGTTTQPVSIDGGLPLPAGAATEATLQLVATEVKLEAVRLLLASLDAKDYATQTTLAALLAAFGAEDFASETTLSFLVGAFLAEDFSSEATLASLLAAFSAEDFATQTTLAALLTAFNAEDFASQTTLEAVRLLLVSLDGKDYATETTQATLATEAKLEAVRVLLASIDAKDFATETTLATRASEATLATRATEATVATLLTDTQLRATPVPVSAASLPLPAGAATEATLATRATETTLATRASEATVAGLLTDTQLRAAAVPVVGPLTDAELRATAVPVSNASLPLPAGAATEATLATRATEVTLATRSSEVTLAALLAAFSAEDFSSETTLAALLAAFSAEDFASETTLATLATEAKLEAVRVLIASIDTKITDGSQIAKSVGDVAHDAADSGAPVKIGGTATALDPTDVDEGDRVQASLDLGGRARGRVYIESGDGSGNLPNVDSSKRLLVSSSAPAPPGTVAVEVLEQGNVLGNSATDTDYVVPDTKVLTILLFFCGGETGGKQSKFELYHSTDAGVTDGTLLAFGYIGNTNNFSVELNIEITGDAAGDQLVRLRRERLDGSSLELAAAWTGNQTT